MPELPEGQGAAVSWVGRIADAVERRPRNVDIAWDVVEARLGTALPADHKELCRCSGAGESSGYVHVYGAPRAVPARGPVGV